MGARVTQPPGYHAHRTRGSKLNDNEVLAQRLYESEPPEPQQPWENVAETTREHYRQFARNLSITG